MNVREQLPLEQQFELRVFENQVSQLSQEDAQTLLVALREQMLYQAATFREMLKESWGIDKMGDFSEDLLAEN